jgi:hypothetical protein
MGNQILLSFTFEILCDVVNLLNVPCLAEILAKEQGRKASNLL